MYPWHKSSEGKYSLGSLMKSPTTSEEKCFVFFKKMSFVFRDKAHFLTLSSFPSISPCHSFFQIPNRIPFHTASNLNFSSLWLWAQAIPSHRSVLAFLSVSPCPFTALTMEPASPTYSFPSPVPSLWLLPCCPYSWYNSQFLWTKSPSLQCSNPSKRLTPSARLTYISPC